MHQPELGKIVLELRQKKGLTQSELAEQCNVSLRTIQRIEALEVNPRSYTTKVILTCLNYNFENSPINQSDNESEINDSKINQFEQLFKYISDLFNLKKNTMKKLSVLSLSLILITLGVFLSNNSINAQQIEGWFLAGSTPKSYTIGLDETTFKTGNKSAFLESTEKKIEGFGTLMQTCSAEDYLGKRIKMTAYIKSKDVADWAGMWLRVDSEQTKKVLSFDNMQDRAIKGTNDWTKCEIILDVPTESGTLNFGVLLRGTGKVWFDNISFEVVEKTKAETNFEKRKPTNLDFGN